MRKTMLLLALCGLVATGCATSSAAGDGSGLAITKAQGADALEVRINGKLFTTYHYSNENRKPFLWPVNGEDGMCVTRSWPMGPGEKTKDHPHHKSLWTSYGEISVNDIEKLDCWGEGSKGGLQVSGTPEFSSDGTTGTIAVTNSWETQDGKRAILEAREYTFYDCPAESRYFDVKVTFTATEGDTTFNDTKEGGLVAVRVRDCIRVQSKGEITNASGAKGEPGCWGKPSPWCDYSGTFEDGKVRGIAVFDHPDNPRHPTRWHVRNYGLMAANCFGLSYFTKSEPEKLNGDFVFKKGESFTWKYRVLIHSGNCEEAKVAQKYDEYAGK